MCRLFSRSEAKRYSIFLTQFQTVSLFEQLANNVRIREISLPIFPCPIHGVLFIRKDKAEGKLTVLFCRDDIARIT